LEVFVDRESIGWGEDWQASIRDGLESATVFLPVITRQYFERPFCRHELLTFHGEAKQLGLTSLLLPVVVLGHSHISGASPDIAVRIVHERQCRDLRDAWIEGPRSATWRRSMVKLAGELVDAVTAAEQALEGDSKRRGTTGSAEDEDAPGAVEVAEALESFQDETKQLMDSLSETLTGFAAVFQNYQQTHSATPAEIRRILAEMAAELQPLGLEFQDSAREFEAVTVRTDEVLRGYVRFLRDNEMTEQLKKERREIKRAENAMGPLGETDSSVTDFLERLRPVETTSAPLRTSLRGFREGAKAVQSGLALMRSWPKIVDG
jgi:hypothetical protein